MVNTTTAMQEIDIALLELKEFSKSETISISSYRDPYESGGTRGQILLVGRRLVATLKDPTGERVSIVAQWPGNWWEAFKERWFPRWLLGKYPIVYKHIYKEDMIVWLDCPPKNFNFGKWIAVPVFKEEDR